MDSKQYSDSLGHTIDQFNEQLVLEIQAHKQTKLNLAAAEQTLSEVRDEHIKYINANLTETQLIREAINADHDRLYSAVHLLRQAKRRMAYLEHQFADARGDDSDGSVSAEGEEPYDSDLDDDAFLQREIDEADCATYDEVEEEDDEEVEESVDECLPEYYLLGTYSNRFPNFVESPIEENFAQNTDSVLQNVVFPCNTSDGDVPPYSTSFEREWATENLASGVHDEAHTYQEIGELHLPPREHPSRRVRPFHPVSKTPTGQTTWWAGSRWIWNGRHWLEHDGHVAGMVHEDNFSDFGLDDGYRC